MNYLNTASFQDDTMGGYTDQTIRANRVNPELYDKYQVKRGLRDLDGRGVLVGLTEIGEVHSYIVDENELIPVPGRLLYRGIDINDLTAGFLKESRHGFEETAYLLLLGTLPTVSQLTEFKQMLAEYQSLPDFFTRDMILHAPGKDLMNILARTVLALYSYDDNADDISISNVLRQCIRLIACFPSLSAHAYQAFTHYYESNSLCVHHPQPDLDIAENILYMLRPDCSFTPLEASILDLLLVLHAEHGGGNNSSFVTHVVSSSGTDTYAVMAAALGSLKGPRHGGANIKVVQMIDDMKQEIRHWDDDEEISQYLLRLINREGFDKTGLIYGFGHAVYSVSDPRAVILKNQAHKLAQEKSAEDEFRLYQKVEELAPQVIGKVRRIYKGVSANIDLYSGFVYSMLNIPRPMYTPLFAIARIVGWSAHRIEELVNEGKIIRPAYKSIAPHRGYISLNNR
ncbi:MAG: citrate/2-methylcitrate synthase [Methylocystaceae bacterium]